MSDKTYTTSEPEFVGKIPVRTELTVLKGDDPGARKISSRVYENLGFEVYLLPDDHPCVFQDEADLEAHSTREALVTGEDDLREGMKLLMDCWGIGIVRKDDEGNFYAVSRSGHTSYALVYDRNRHPSPPVRALLVLPQGHEPEGPLAPGGQEVTHPRHDEALT